jgi:hypothetical protein
MTSVQARLIGERVQAALSTPTPPPGWNAGTNRAQMLAHSRI